MNKLWIIAKEVYRKNVKSWGFFFLVAGPFLIFGISALIGYFISRDEMSQANATIAIVSQAPDLEASLAQDNPGFQLVYYEDEATARQAVAQDQVAGYLTLQQTAQGLAGTFYQKSTARSLNLAGLSESLNHYQLGQIGRSLNLNNQDIQTIRNSRVSLDKVNLKQDADGSYSEENAQSLKAMARTASAFVALILAYMMILTYSAIIAQEVALEKGNRVMEIILSSIPAKQHLLGKFLGGVLVMLTQVVIYIILGVGFYFLTGVSDIFAYLAPFRPLVGDVLPIFGLTMVFGVVGIMGYLILSVLLGSMVSRIEDVQKSIQPLVFTSIIGFYIAMYGVQQPNSPVVVVGSWIPFLSPFIMPVRIAADSVGTIETILCLLGCLLFMVLAFWLALTFYKSTVLSTSDQGVIQAIKRSYTLWKSERHQKA